MALTVETGAVVANAESYVTVAEADTYWSYRNNGTWAAAAPAAKEAALREATQFLDGSYKWAGSLVSSAQKLLWPRVVGIDRSGREISSTSIPSAIKSAQCELALEALGGRLMASLERGGAVASESVGALSVSYFQGAPGSRKYPFINLIVKDLTESGAGSVSIDAVRG